MLLYSIEIIIKSLQTNYQLKRNFLILIAKLSYTVPNALNWLGSESQNRLKAFLTP